MDPRHPEQAVSRMIELMAQFSGVENTMKKATTSAELANLEREASLVVQEICLVAPRLHEAMMQTSRMRRAELARGVSEDIKQVIEEASIVVEKAKEVVAEIVEKKAETSTKTKKTKKSKKAKK